MMLMNLYDDIYLGVVKLAAGPELAHARLDVMRAVYLALTNATHKTRDVITYSVP